MASSRLGRGSGSAANPVAEFFDIKFCPDQPLNNDPVFAAVSKKQVSLPVPGRVSLAHQGRRS